MARPRQALLTKERIVEAAAALIDAEGLDACSMRRLATELGVQGPSLYNHFATKAEIVDAVAEAVVAQVDISVFHGNDWRAALRLWAKSYHAVLAAHPNVVPVLATGPGRRPAGLAMAEAVYGALIDAGWSRARATHIGALMRYLITGSALGSFALGFDADPELYDHYPHLHRAHELAAHRDAVDEGAFELGLDLLITSLSDRYDLGVRR
ncbi:TetR family transcriptional regulator [Actinoplanes lobatus]|uniref:AcrR family transcriptional regulator n=1 Tax=Actinoplanes lobatus TaxID=113568 RepID=A0A7W7MEA9_9ACTN|nr:TetR/AcrR family transcriptional regulator [Actinoplanes lobatus]MBB4747091.1 AcrR family transcriptional regulator [Actinoplanes lobatus]GGN55683.1 TetR family transcriptional regulator [Actinoplanes lobatus]GIE39342.1 TetR family transcriptional regulator [Actinoplanes lobatus]